MTNAPALGVLPADRRSGAERPFLAIGLVLLAVSLFSVMDSLSKRLVEHLDPIEVVWGRYLAILFLLALPVLRRPALLATSRPSLHVLRGIAVFGSAVLFIAGLQRLPMADCTAIGFASPLMVTALSIPLLGEQVGARRWSAVAAGFFGVLVVVHPGSGAIGAAALWPLCSAACWAVGMVLTRRMAGADAVLTTLCLSSLAGFLLSSLALPLVWRPMGLLDGATMAAMGVLSASGQYLLIIAFSRGAASLLAPFSYSQMIWSTLMGYLVFGAVPVASTWCGAVIIIASGVYIAHRERLRARAR